MFTSNPYVRNVISPYGQPWNRATNSNYMGAYYRAQPIPAAHYANIVQTVALNKELNDKAQATIDAMEPKQNIWQRDVMERPAMAEKGQSQQSIIAPAPNEKKPKFLSRLLSSSSTPSSSSTSTAKLPKDVPSAEELVQSILREETARWPDEWRDIVRQYQIKTGMLNKIAHLRLVAPIQYLHLLRAGYFEPIPVGKPVRLRP